MYMQMWKLKRDNNILVFHGLCSFHFLGNIFVCIWFNDLKIHVLTVGSIESHPYMME